jgi:hypothetical protein
VGFVTSGVSGIPQVQNFTPESSAALAIVGEKAAVLASVRGLQRALE